MSPETYQRLCNRTECDQGAARLRYNTLRAVRLNHAVIGLAGEIGELASLVEKHLHYGQPLDEISLKDELGDCLWYISLACNALGINLADVMTANIAKLTVRYPDKYSDDCAAHRDRQAEAQVMTGELV